MPNICVYCGSSSGNNPAFTAAARALGAAIAGHGYGLVYGGASIGLMGTVADSVMASGGDAIGVMPQSLADKEIAHQQLSTLYITSSMHERKTKMADLSDAFVALPGGLGTLEELFEIWTWGQLAFHQKPIGLLNVEGYFSGLITFLDNSQQAGFIKPEHLQMLTVADKPEHLLEKMASYTPPTAGKLQSPEK